MYQSTRKSTLAVALSGAILASAALSASASAGATTFKAVGGKLSVLAANGDANNISIEQYGSNSFRVKDLGTGVTLSPGAGIGSQAYYAANDVSFLTDAPVTSIRVNGRDLGDTIDTSLTPLPAQLLGTTGNDTITAGSASATISGGAGNDTLNGGSADDSILGGTGSDLLFGNAGDDLLFAAGDTGNDQSQGGAGDDVGTGDLGYDTLTQIESIITSD